MDKKIIAFDLDDIICRRKIETNSIEKYHTCYPIDNFVKIVNSAHEQGHHIIIYTARGMNVFKKDVKKVYDNLFEITSNQLKTWGVKYHELVMGKIHYDILIDDKAINSLRINSLEDINSFFNNN